MNTAVLRTFLIGLIGISLVGTSTRSADLLPNQLSDAAFWRIASDFSEADGYFPFDNFLSNEASYQTVIPQLRKIAKPDGVYLGVGPEQNFTYIAALQPRMAFIIDIRRQNLLELLMYKALFETSADRNEFVSRLFSRVRAAGLNEASTANALFRAYESMEASPEMLPETVEEVTELLTETHGIPLSSNDQQTIERILRVFMAEGPRIHYDFSRPSAIPAPTYSDLMTATDDHGKPWSYLASEDNFQRIRSMQKRNMIVPLVGDFAGEKTLRAIAQYLNEHGSTVTAFYLSNVEQYLQMNDMTWVNFRFNIAALPIDRWSRFIRFIPPWSTQLASISEFVEKNPPVKKADLWQLLGAENH